MDTTSQAIAELMTALSPEAEAKPAPAETQPGDSGLIFPHQREVFRQLVTAAKAFSRENWLALPVLPRWHLLLTGATGTGKSHVVRALAKHLGLPLLPMFVTRWIIAGARGKETWAEIAQWLASQTGKCIIFLDEVDKLTGDDTWSRHLRTEIFQLLDRDLPAEISIDDSDSDHGREALWAKAQMNLRCNVLIVGAGAFQALWDFRPKNLGFGGETSETIVPSQHELKSVIPPEMINRFWKILALPPLGQTDYVAMIRRTAEALPSELRDKFIRISDENLAEAIRDGQGARYVEECLTSTLIEDANEKPRHQNACFLSASP